MGRLARSEAHLLTTLAKLLDLLQRQKQLELESLSQSLSQERDQKRLRGAVVLASRPSPRSTVRTSSGSIAL